MLNRSLAAKIGLWLSGIVLMLALFGWDILGDMDRLQIEAEIIETSNHQSHELHAIELGIHQHIELVKKFLVTGDYRLEKRFTQQHHFLLDTISAYAATYHIPSSNMLDTRLRAMQKKAVEVFQLPLAVGNMEGPILIQELDSISQKVVQELSLKHHELDNQVNRAMNMMHGLRLDMRGEAVALLAVLLVTILLLTHFIYSNVVLPLVRMRKAVQQLGSGNFVVQCDVSSQDEIGELGAAFNAMGNTLQERENMLNQARSLAAYQEKMNALGFMSAGIAHEVGNPLAIISVSLQVAQMKLQSQDFNAVSQQLHTSLKATERMESIIQLILNFGRQEAEGNHYFSAHQVIEDAIKLAKMAPDTKHISIHKQLKANLAKVYGSNDKLSQVLINLILNAMHACQKHGEVYLRAFAQSVAGNQGIVIEVRDTGHGIAKNLRADIFNPNFTTKAKGEGTGLGLAISQALMQSMAGSLHLMPQEESKQQGCCFQAWLPSKESV